MKDTKLSSIGIRDTTLRLAPLDSLVISKASVLQSTASKSAVAAIASTWLLNFNRIASCADAEVNSSGA